jgi:hypothetical protein
MAEIAVLSQTGGNGHSNDLNQQMPINKKPCLWQGNIV